MPQPRQYASQALRQAAYRRRSRLSQDQLLLSKGLPMGPAIATMPGSVRWKAAIKQSENLIAVILEEMQQYHDDRSETWQESDQAQAFLERMESIQELADQFGAVAE